jgi:DNA polymerase III subunit gamma/tau
MSFDTEYRPLVYKDVIGQDSLITLCKQYVLQGKGFHQSYLFAGPYGSGKTTVARILARALLCENPVNGEPCDQCDTCKSMLTTGSAMDFTEVDAATNSGKAEILKITEEIQYDSFTGRRRVYLFDECHQLSGSALDAMLKPMEEEVIPGGGDKRLVCIFCTTEPERVRPTIFSRCAPTFMIQTITVDSLAKRLAYVCSQKGFQYEEDLLKVIASVTECHVRDALKALEGISLLGPVDKANVSKYLRLDLNGLYLDVLENLGSGSDLSVCLAAAKRLLEKVSPVTCYEKLAEYSLLAYEVYLKANKAPVYMDSSRIVALGERQSHNLLGFAQRFSSRPGKPTASMLLCDLGSLHYGGFVTSSPVMQISVPSAQVQALPINTKENAKPTVNNSPTSMSKLDPSGGIKKVVDLIKIPGIVITPKGAIGGRDQVKINSSDGSEFEPECFCRLLRDRLNGSTR